MSEPAFCDAQIWPSWANRWTRCGSAIKADGRCAQYGHRRESHRVNDLTSDSDADFQAAHARWDTADDEGTVEKVARALRDCHLSGKPYKPRPSGPPETDWSEFALAAIHAMKEPQ